MATKAKEYRFNPRDDMTLQELIKLIQISRPLAYDWFVKLLPPDVARHFDVVE